ncbi:MAG TPA: hypothetical protein VM327_09765 [Candidatus Thermoplasmatota archaeon]|nr:hypothetical protein [Candidatus Thermoplasmatota archaeon]
MEEETGPTDLPPPVRHPWDRVGYLLRFLAIVLFLFGRLYVSELAAWLGALNVLVVVHMVALVLRRSGLLATFWFAFTVSFIGMTVVLYFVQRTRLRSLVRT